VRGADGVDAEESSLRIADSTATTHHAAQNSEEITKCVKAAKFLYVRHISGNEFVASK